MTRDTGGPAFPGIEAVVTGIDSDGIERIDTEACGGMTLRDYFAAKALPVAMTVPWSEIGYVPVNGLTDIQQHARLAYRIADAMLAERVKL